MPLPLFPYRCVGEGDFRIGRGVPRPYPFVVRRNIFSPLYLLTA